MFLTEAQFALIAEAMFPAIEPGGLLEPPTEGLSRAARLPQVGAGS